jgi:hypothetical protein
MASIEDAFNFLASPEGQKIQKKNRKYTRKKKFKAFCIYILQNAFLPILVSLITTLLTLMITGN